MCKTKLDYNLNNIMFTGSYTTPTIKSNAIQEQIVPELGHESAKNKQNDHKQDDTNSNKFSYSEEQISQLHSDLKSTCLEIKNFMYSTIQGKIVFLFFNCINQKFLNSLFKI